MRLSHRVSSAIDTFLSSVGSHAPLHPRATLIASTCSGVSAIAWGGNLRTLAVVPQRVLANGVVPGVRLCIRLSRRLRAVRGRASWSKVSLIAVGHPTATSLAERACRTRPGSSRVFSLSSITELISRQTLRADAYNSLSNRFQTVMSSV
jgi:hypothetical protein